MHTHMLVFSLISITPGQALRCTDARRVLCFASDEKQARAARTPVDCTLLRPAAVEGHWRAFSSEWSFLDVPGPQQRALTSPGPAFGPSPPTGFAGIKPVSLFIPERLCPARSANFALWRDLKRTGPNPFIKTELAVAGRA